LNTSYNISTFFWYFEARKAPEKAPLVIYLSGGPGDSSLYGTVGLGGPCYLDHDANSTHINPWSWNNESNLLYIDQPAQTGFSYDTLINGTFDVTTGIYTPMDFSDGVPFTPNSTTLIGTFPSQLESQTANNSVQAAHALYHFTQTWVNEYAFPFLPTNVHNCLLKLTVCPGFQSIGPRTPRLVSGPTQYDTLEIYLEY
jgi:Serine carboxypeptidase